MKKIMITFLSIIIILSLVGCTKVNNNNNNVDSNSGATIQLRQV